MVSAIIAKRRRVSSVRAKPNWKIYRDLKVYFFPLMLRANLEHNLGTDLFSVIWALNCNIFRLCAEFWHTYGIFCYQSNWIIIKAKLYLSFLVFLSFGPFYTPRPRMGSILACAKKYIYLISLQKLLTHLPAHDWHVKPDDDVAWAGRASLCVIN